MVIKKKNHPPVSIKTKQNKTKTKTNFIHLRSEKKSPPTEKKNNNPTPTSMPPPENQMVHPLGGDFSGQKRDGAVNLTVSQKFMVKDIRKANLK